MEDFAVQVRLYNNQLKERRLALKMTQKEIAEAIGISLGNYGPYECFGYNLEKSNVPKPYNPETGVWSNIAKSIAAFHCVELEQLFPESVLAVDRNLVERKLSGMAAEALVSEAQTRRSLPPDVHFYEQKELSQTIDAAMVQLNPREKKVVSRLFYGSYATSPTTSLAAEMGVTRERVRQIAAKALRKIRYGCSSKQLKEYHEALCDKEGLLEEVSYE